MDMIVVDLSDLPEVQEGERSSSSGDPPAADGRRKRLAKALRTIPYEVLAG